VGAQDLGRELVAQRRIAGEQPVDRRRESAAHVLRQELALLGVPQPFDPGRGATLRSCSPRFSGAAMV